MMRAGGLTQIVEIEERVQTGTDELNQPQYAWQVVREIFASVEARRGNEFFDQATKQRYSETIFRFRCNFIDAQGITTAMRIKFEGQVFDIKALLPDYACREDCVIDATAQNATV